MLLNFSTLACHWISVYAPQWTSCTRNSQIPYSIRAQAPWWRKVVSTYSNTRSNTWANDILTDAALAYLSEGVKRELVNFNSGRIVQPRDAWVVVSSARVSCLWLYVANSFCWQCTARNWQASWRCSVICFWTCSHIRILSFHGKSFWETRFVIRIVRRVCDACVVVCNACVSCLTFHVTNSFCWPCTAKHVHASWRCPVIFFRMCLLLEKFGKTRLVILYLLNDYYECRAWA